MTSIKIVFEDWLLEHKELLDAHNISEDVAKIIWESAKASAIVAYSDLIYSGVLIVNPDKA